MLAAQRQVRLRLRAPFVGAALLALLAGCPIGPDYVRPKLDLNAEWQEHRDPRLLTKSAIDRAWWRGFHDAALDRLVEMAFHQSLSLQVSGLRILEARARLGIAVWNQFPQAGGINASAAAIGLSQHAANGAGLDRHFADYQFGFDSLWEIDFWRKYRRGVKAEKASYLATVADFDSALVALTAEIARTYTLVRTYEVLVDLATTNLEVQEESLRIAQARLRNGSTSALDVSQAKTLLENTRASIPDLRATLQQTHNALCTLLGRPTGCATVVLAAARGIPIAPSQVGVSVPAEMLRQRPDIHAAELRAVAQCDRIGIAKAELFPRFVLLGSLGFQSSNGAAASSDAGSITNLFNPASLIYNIGVRMIWPILSYGRIMNNVRVEDARFQQALVEYQSTVIRAAQEVDDGIVGFLRQQEAAAFGQDAVAAAQDAVKLALVQYREGAVDFQRVLDTQRVLLQTQSGLARAQSAVVTNLISLYKALGGGWEMRDGQPVVPDAVRIEMQKRTNWGRYLKQPPAAPSPPASR